MNLKQYLNECPNSSAIAGLSPSEIRRIEKLATTVQDFDWIRANEFWWRDANNDPEPEPKWILKDDIYDYFTDEELEDQTR